MKNELSFASDERDIIGEALSLFGSNVDPFLRSPDENETVPDSVEHYAAAVERAASDLANRRRRRDEISNIVKSSLEGTSKLSTFRQ